MRSCVRSQLMYFFSSNNNYVIQIRPLTRGNVCKHSVLTRAVLANIVVCTPEKMFAIFDTDYCGTSSNLMQDEIYGGRL
jgi:hypothetical protein